jgi:hypothetical protein
MPKGNRAKVAPRRAPQEHASVLSWSPGTVRQVALGVGAAQTAMVAWAIATSGYFKDDFPFFTQARQGGFSGSDLTRPVFASLIPGFQLGNSILASFHPIPRWPAVVLPVVLYALALFLVFRLGTLLFGPRPEVIALMALAGCSGVLATSLVWWTAALNSLPAVVCDLLALDCLARHAVTGQRRYLVVSIVSFAVGVSFYDASSSFIVVLVAFCALFVIPAASWRALGRGLVQRIPLWLGYLVPIALNFTWRQLHRTEYALPPLPGLGTAVRFVAAGWAQGFVPSSLGITFDSLAQGADRVLAVIVGQAVVLAVVGMSMYRRRAAWRAWVLFAGGFGALEVIAVIGRGSSGTLFAIHTVYWTAQPFLLVLALGLAFLPNQLRDDGDVPRQLPAPARQWRVIGVVLAIGTLVSALGVASIWSSADRHQGAASRAYADNVAQTWRAATAAHADAFVWDTQVPNYVVTPLFVPYNRVSTTVGLLLSLRVDAVAGHGYVIGDNGALTAAIPSVVSRARPTCLRSQPSSRTAVLALRTPVPSGNWFLRVRYDRSSGFTATIAGQSVTFAKGSGSFLIVDTPPVGTATASIDLPARSGLCVSSADFEAPVVSAG